MVIIRTICFLLEEFMQKKYILAASAALVIIAAGAFTYNVRAQRNNGIAAVVNGEQITVAQVKEFYEGNPQIAGRIPFELIYNSALDALVNSKLALQAATAANIQATPEYQKALAEMQDEVARQIYVEQQVKNRVTDEEVKKMYDEYVNNFKAEKEIKAKHILVDEEKLAKDIIEQLNNKSASFDDLAKKYSKDQPDLGYFTAEAMVPEFSEVAFALDKDTYNKEPVKSQFGYHVILVEDIRDSQPLPIEAMAPQISAKLSQQAVAEVINDLNTNAQIEKFDLDGKKIEAPKEAE